MAITNTIHRPASYVALARTPVPARAVFGLLGLWTEWQERHRLRKDLRRLLRAAPHMIDDMGLTRRAAGQESVKPFWQA